jgi:hypothetical protein
MSVEFYLAAFRSNILYSSHCKSQAVWIATPLKWDPLVFFPKRRSGNIVIRCVKSQESANCIYTVQEAWSHAWDTDRQRAWFNAEDGKNSWTKFDLLWRFINITEVARLSSVILSFLSSSETPSARRYTRRPLCLIEYQLQYSFSPANSGPLSESAVSGEVPHCLETAMLNKRKVRQVEQYWFV